MVAVDVQIARHLQLEIKQAVPGEGRQHVIEKADSGVDACLAAAV
jgi:hypothetical protein